MRLTIYLTLLILLFTVFGLHKSHAQILDVYQGKLYNNDCQFNERFIMDNKIKTITGKISVKKDMQPISNKGLIVRYSFDRIGRLSEQIKTMSLRGGRIDTTQSSFSYSQNNQLVQKAQFYVKAYDAIRYSYNNKNEITSEMVVRGANNNQYKYGFDKGSETIVKQERYEWQQLNDTTQNVVYYNSAERPYKERTIILNVIGQKQSENTTYYLTKKRNLITYKYDPVGRLIKIIDYSNLGSQRTITNTYEYDEYGNLYNSKIYTNGKLSYTQEFLYDPQTLFLSAQLSKDESARSIKIIQYEYKFY
ncbi:MAG: hypothetical protein OSB25_10215 [Salibacteraceae bacterium]|nr:hypothetical protein [Salibacteraceae bacterium]|tara:strand:- start:1320 stop:2237 length:918 start_codon:yes stop_codon:yes gene_type:complete